MYKSNTFFIVLFILNVITFCCVKAVNINQDRQLLEKKSKEISDMAARLRATYNDLEVLGNQQIENIINKEINGNPGINKSLEEIQALKKLISTMTPRLILAMGKLDPTGLRDTLKILNIAESVLLQTKKILLDVKKSLATTTRTLNPSIDPLKIYSKLNTARTNMDSTIQDLKIFEAVLQ